MKILQAEEELEQKRGCYPYISLVLNKACGKDFRYRETLFNCASPKISEDDILPKAPPAFLTYHTSPQKQQKNDFRPGSEQHPTAPSL